jgi:hypothetical protein
MKPTNKPTNRTCLNLAANKPHILKAKGGGWHVAAMSTVPRHLVEAAIKWRNVHLEPIPHEPFAANILTPVT